MSTRRKEVHIVVGCSDARDVGSVFVRCIDAVQARYRVRGIDVEFHSIRTPGSFATNDVVEDLHRIVESSERAVRRLGTEIAYFVHLQTHGEVAHTPDAAPDAVPLERLEIVHSSPFNCGMLNAGQVGIELERRILSRKPTVHVRGEPRVLLDEQAIHRLLHDVYAFSGYMAGDWIRSIEDLRTHPRLQKSTLLRAIAADRTMRNVPIAITAGIQDYSQHRYFRVEDDPPTFWDEVYELLRERLAALPPTDPEIARRTEKQQPALGLFAMGDIPESRDLAAAHFARGRGVDPVDCGPSRVFTFSSDSFDVPRSPFGPYTVAGFFFAVVHLHLTHFVVLGHDAAQAARMVTRLLNDPLVSFIAADNGVTFDPVGLEGDAAT